MDIPSILFGLAGGALGGSVFLHICTLDVRARAVQRQIEEHLREEAEAAAQRAAAAREQYAEPDPV